MMEQQQTNAPRGEDKAQSNSTVLIVVLAVVAVLLIIVVWVVVVWAIKRSRAQSDASGDKKDVPMQQAAAPGNNSRYEEGLFEAPDPKTQTQYDNFD